MQHFKLLILLGMIVATGISLSIERSLTPDRTTGSTTASPTQWSLIEAPEEPIASSNRISQEVQEVDDALTLNPCCIPQYSSNELYNNHQGLVGQFYGPASMNTVLL